MASKVTPNRIVNYHLDHKADGCGEELHGQPRPALVVTTKDAQGSEPATVCLHVFTAGEADGLPPFLVRPAVQLSEEGKPGRWSWPKIET